MSEKHLKDPGSAAQILRHWLEIGDNFADVEADLLEVLELAQQVAWDSDLFLEGGDNEKLVALANRIYALRGKLLDEEQA